MARHRRDRRQTKHGPPQSILTCADWQNIARTAQEGRDFELTVPVIQIKRLL
jgi:hypothetical protein